MTLSRLLPTAPSSAQSMGAPGGSGEVLLRPVTVDDAAAFAEAQRRNREHLRPWEPRRSEAWFTQAEQAARLREQLERVRTGQVYPWVLLRGDRIVGGVNLNTVVPGPFRSASMGYWVDFEEAGRGLATAAVAAVCQLADEQLRLHRIEASTLTNNAASQRVLAKCGFEQIGAARDYLHIDGAWRDCLLFQIILNDRPPGE